MNADAAWCHDCDEGLPGWSDFIRHANAGHAVTNGRCPGRCQFREAAS